MKCVYDVEILVIVTDDGGTIGGRLAGGPFPNPARLVPRIWASTYASHEYKADADAAVAGYLARGIQARVVLKHLNRR